VVSFNFISRPDCLNHYDHYTDEELLSFIKNDDVASFRILYDRYWKQLLLKANHLLRSNQDAEDVVHDVFTDIWKRKNEIDLETSFRAYVGAAVNYSCLRKLAERKVIAINAESESADLSTQQYLSLRELQKRFNLALGELPEKCRLIFRMSREEGLSDKEIASKLQLSLPTIRTQIHRAITKLKWSLGQFLFLVFFF
jgi:RNA polymerase sigma-70 factor (family 1)